MYINCNILTGSFAVICLMAGKVVMTHSSSHNPIEANNTIVTSYDEVMPIYRPLEVATAVSFMVGLYQVGNFILFLIYNEMLYNL